MAKQIRGINRDDRIDILKAIGIILMVCGHCGVPFRSFIYLFHMAIFFIASGYCFNAHNSEDSPHVLKFILRKLKGLWLPYVLSMIAYSILHNIFIWLNIYTDNTDVFQYLNSRQITLTNAWTLAQIIENILKSLLLHGHTQMGSALWFVATLMEISVLYCVLNFVIRKCIGEKRIEVFQFLFSASFLGLGYFMATRNIECGGWNRIFSFYTLFFIGVEIRRYSEKFLHKIAIYGKWIALCSFVILLLLQRNEVALDQNQYVNPGFLIIVSFLGWLLTFSVADIISKFKAIKKPLVILGQNTMPVVILHFLSFKIVNLLGVLVLGLPKYCIAAFPVLVYDDILWIVYAIVGVIVPVICKLGLRKLGCYIKKYLQ